jgi:hypothetical protein
MPDIGVHAHGVLPYAFNGTMLQAGVGFRDPGLSHTGKDRRGVPSSEQFFLNCVSQIVAEIGDKF